MNNFRYRFMEFMQGRNGTDELYLGMLGIYTLMVIVNAFVRSTVFSIIIWVWLALTFFRFFSKNIYARQKENSVVLNLISKIKRKDFKKDPYEVKVKKESKLKKKINKHKTMFKSRKTHVFKKCPECGVTIRLPKKKGKHTVCCPKCNKDFEVKIR